jgi:hypothetical protein
MQSQPVWGRFNARAADSCTQRVKALCIPTEAIVSFPTAVRKHGELPRARFEAQPVFCYDASLGWAPRRIKPVRRPQGAFYDEVIRRHALGLRDHTDHLALDCRATWLRRACGCTAKAVTY